MKATLSLQLVFEMWSDGLSRLSDLDGGARVSRGNGKATGIDRD